MTHRQLRPERLLLAVLLSELPISEYAEPNHAVLFVAVLVFLAPNSRAYQGVTDTDIAMHETARNVSVPMSYPDNGQCC